MMEHLSKIYIILGIKYNNYEIYKFYLTEKYK